MIKLQEVLTPETHYSELVHEALGFDSPQSIVAKEYFRRITGLEIAASGAGIKEETYSLKVSDGDNRRIVLSEGYWIPLSEYEALQKLKDKASKITGLGYVDGRSHHLSPASLPGGMLSASMSPGYELHITYTPNRFTR